MVKVWSWAYEHLHNRGDASVLVLQMPPHFFGWGKVADTEIVPTFNI